MPKSMKAFFLAHFVVALVFGLLLLIIPGRFLLAMDWPRIDPIVSRIAGAALLGLGWGSFQLWRSKEPEPDHLLIQVEAIFTGLACVGLLRHLLFFSNPVIVWVAFVIMAASAAGWALTLRRSTPTLKNTPPTI